MKTLQGGTESQRQFAKSIRDNVLKQFPWGLNPETADDLQVRISTLSSALFFIKNKAELERGELLICLARYDEENYLRRLQYVQKH